MKWKPKKQGRRFRSLSITLALSFFLLTLSTLLVAGGLATYFALRTQRQVIANDQQLIAENAANEVKKFVQERFTTLQLTARLDNLPALTPAQQKIVLDKLIGLDPAFRRLVIFDSNGKQIQTSSRLSSYSPAQAPDVPRILAQNSKNKDYVGDIYIDPTTSEPLIVQAVPIKNVFGDFRGVLLAEVNLKFMWDLVGNIKVGKTGQAYVVDKSGSLIAYGDISRVLAGENLKSLTEVGGFLRNKNDIGTADLSQGPGINGTQVAAMHVALGSPDWAVVTELPITEAYAPVIRNLVGSAVVITVSAALVVVTSFYLSRRLIRPLRDLRNVVIRIGEGDLSIRSNINSHNEIGELARTFNQMTENLQSSGRQLHEEHARLTASINSLEVGFLMTDLRDELVTINSSARKLLGDTDPTDHAPWRLLQVTQSLSGNMDLPKILRQCRETRQTMNLKEVTFGSRMLHVFVGPILTHSEQGATNAIGCVVLLEDITEAIIQTRSRDEFFSIASHELRTPLTAIRGNASLIMQLYEKSLKDPELHGMVYDIHESSTRLIDIVNDFLDLSRLEQGKVSLSTTAVAVDEVIENVIYEMRAILSEKNLSLDYNRKTLGELPKAWADKDRLKQVIYNLVGNAAKFTEHGGITLAVNREDTMLKVTVADTGRGISPEGQRLLFHKFQQAGESLLTRDTTRGTGLGLYISKILVETMGGRIALESSTEGKGSVFSFSIPIASAAAQTSSTVSKTLVDARTGLTADPVELAATLLTRPSTASTKTKTSATQENKLLVIEDDPYVIRLYERMFSNIPIQFKTATSGSAGLKLARSFKPHLILLDVMMPGMNGLETLDALKADPATKDIAVIMLSSLGEESAVKAARSKGAANYLIKSDFTPEQIRDKITEKLQINHAAKAKQ